MTGMDVARLREVAQKATPGPWECARTELGYAVHRGEHTTIALYCHPDNAEHIAAFDPPTVLALLDVLADREARLAAVEALCDEWRQDLLTNRPTTQRDLGWVQGVEEALGQLEAALHPDPTPAQGGGER